MLFAKVLRSPLPHARIKRIDAAAALRVRGVECIFTGARIGKKICDTPLLADGVVRFAGEKVAAVAAQTEEAARQALDLIEVEYGKTEELRYDDAGRVLTASLGDYKIPTTRDIPELKTFVMQLNEGSGPYASMSIGETALIPTAAAIANAVQDAVGVRLKSLPITAEKVLNGINGR
jgi:CO/xanthine dehydrogenase Mo-binding subunit